MAGYSFNSQGDLTIRVGADVSSAKKAYREAIDATAKLASVSVKDVKKLEGANKAAAKSFDKLAKNAEKSGVSVLDAMKKMKEASKNVSAGFSRIQAVGGAIAGAAVVKGVYNLAKDAVDLGDAYDKMAGRTGYSVEALSRLSYVAGQCGTDISVVENAIKDYTNRLDAAKQGSKESSEAFRRLGLSVQTLDLTPREKQFELIVEALSKVEDANERAALSVKIFGESGLKLGNIVKSGKEGLDAYIAEAERAGAVMTTATASAAAEAADRFGELEAATKGLKIEIGEGLLPFLRTLVAGFAEGIEKARELGGEIASISTNGGSDLGKRERDAEKGRKDAQEYRDRLDSQFRDVETEKSKAVGSLGTLTEYSGGVKSAQEIDEATRIAEELNSEYETSIQVDWKTGEIQGLDEAKEKIEKVLGEKFAEVRTRVEGQIAANDARLKETGEKERKDYLERSERIDAETKYLPTTREKRQEELRQSRGFGGYQGAARVELDKYRENLGELHTGKIDLTAAEAGKESRIKEIEAEKRVKEIAEKKKEWEEEQKKGASKEVKEEKKDKRNEKEEKEKEKEDRTLKEIEQLDASIQEEDLKTDYDEPIRNAKREIAKGTYFGPSLDALQAEASEKRFQGAEARLNEKEKAVDDARKKVDDARKNGTSDELKVALEGLQGAIEEEKDARSEFDAAFDARKTLDQGGELQSSLESVGSFSAVEAQSQADSFDKELIDVNKRQVDLLSNIERKIGGAFV